MASSPQNGSMVQAMKSSPYPEVWGISDAYQVFNLKEGGISPESLDNATSIVVKHVDVQSSRVLGYQCNMHVDACRYVSHYLDTSLNNFGDPFVEGNFTPNTKFMERAVLDYYARLWHAAEPHDKNNLDSYWGFVLTMGSTEGNLYAMWNARDYLAGKKVLVSVEAGAGTTVRIPEQGRVNVPQFVYHSAPPSRARSINAYTPIAFYSEDTHNFNAKTMLMLGIRTFSAEGSASYPGQCPLRGTSGEWPAEVPSDGGGGGMNMDALATLVEFFASRGHPVIVSFNYGTTFKGAYDDVEKGTELLAPILKRYGLYERKVHWSEDDPEVFDIRSGFWFHVDGALGASFMPYVEMAYNGGLMEKKGPMFDFRLPMVHSISTSGHKWLGTAMPTGVYMTKNKYRMNIPDQGCNPGAMPDTTLAGSRNGLSAMILWYHLARRSLQEQIKKSVDLLELAAAAEAMLRQLQDDVLHEDLCIGRSELSLAVHFKRVNESLCKKYSLANHTIDGTSYSHIFIMEHVTEKLLSEFIEDLKLPGAFHHHLHDLGSRGAAVGSRSAVACKGHSCPENKILCLSFQNLV